MDTANHIANCAILLAMSHIAEESSQSKAKRVLCACGCNKFLPDCKHPRKNRSFLVGHSNKGANNSQWKGGVIINYHGYRLIKAPDNPMTNPNGYMLEHRLVMSRMLSRPLTPNEDIHHVNGNKLDNRLENLQLMSDCAHGTLHARKDMSGRVCCLCGSKTTQIGLTGKNRTPWAMWHRAPNGQGHVCRKCYNRERRRKRGSKQRAYEREYKREWRRRHMRRTRREMYELGE